MSKGDVLASGGKSAQFQPASNQGELENDLKILPRLSVKEKYGVTDSEYWDALDLLSKKEPLPNWKIEEDFQAPGISLPPIELQPIATIEEKQTFGYEGDPTGDCVLVQRVEREHSSNLILPDSLKAKSDIGFVKAVGESVKFYKPGQLILFDKFASHGADISLIDEDGIERQMLLLREYDITMRLKKITLTREI